MDALNPSWQVLFIDVLLVLGAGGGMLWFRQWIKAQKRGLDEQLQALQGQQRQLSELNNQLLAACSALGGGRPERTKKLEKSGREKEYEEARSLLAKGDDPAEVARRLGLGRAEVEVIKRVLQRRG